MPSYCAVFKCNSNAAKTRGIKYFRFPSVFGVNRKVCPLRSERLQKWIQALKRQDFSETKAKHARICSKHFQSGEPSDLHEKDHPDWVPNVNMGYKQSIVPKSLNRFEIANNRSKAEAGNGETESNDNIAAVQHEVAHLNTSQNPSTDLSLALRTANERIYKLESKLSQYTLNESYFENNDQRVNYYTGFPKFNYLKSVFEFVEPFLSSNNLLSKFQQLVLTLMKLRLNLQFTDLGNRFLCHRTTASRTFEKVLDILFARLKCFITWPSREDLQLNMPKCFKDIFDDKVTVIIDCFELLVQKPSNLEASAKLWSNYKHHHTIKFLIGISPQGTIMFISNAYGGRASDKFITKDSGFLNNLIRGDLILADRGFSIDEHVQIYSAKVMYPTYLKGKNQLEAIDTEPTRKLASVRIHVERVIGLLRRKYRILTEEFPISCLRKASPEIAQIDKIVVVCSALLNLCPSIIPL